MLVLIHWISDSCFCQTINDPAIDARIHKGIDYVYNLSFDSATVEFQSVINAQPKHPAGYFYLAMVDWWRIVSDIENTSRDDGFLSRLDNVIDLCDEILDNNENDITALFFKGGALGFQGRLHGNREDWIKAANAGRNALPIVQETYKLAPTNNEVLFGIGIYNYYAAVIPEQYPFVKPFMIFFPSGDKAKGINQLRQASEKAMYANTEATYFLLQLLFNFEKQYPEALLLAQKLHAKYPNNVLFHRYVGRCNAALGNWEQLETVFNDIIAKTEKRLPGYDALVEREARYYLGLRNMESRSYNSALEQLYRCDELSRTLDGEKFTGFMVMANLKIGMIYDLQGKRALALSQYEKVLQMKDFQNAHSLAEQYKKTPYKKA